MGSHAAVLPVCQLVAPGGDQMKTGMVAERQLRVVAHMQTVGCSLASVKSKAKKKRKRDQDDSDEADEFSESDSELGEPSLLVVSVYIMSKLALSAPN